MFLKTDVETELTDVEKDLLVKYMLSHLLWEDRSLAFRMEHL